MTDEQTPQEQPENTEERPADAAERLGRALGRFARRARESGADAAFRERKPEIDRIARQVRDQARAAGRAAKPHIEHAAEVARPRVEQAGREATARTARFVREHDTELRQAATTGAHLATSRMGPPLLRPVITAVTDEITRPRPPRVDPNSPPPPREPPDEGATGTP
jgi:hypothetical protein